MSNPYSNFPSDDISMKQRSYQQQQFNNQQQQYPFQPQFVNQNHTPQQNANFIQDPKAQLAYQIGSKAIGNFFNGAQIDPTTTINNLTSDTTFGNLSQYFQVSNEYVLKKLKIILCPFLNKSWTTVTDVKNNSIVLPRDNVNAPDMYLPIMSLVTYILIWNFTKGLIGQYDPKYLYSKMSATLAMSLLDLMILKLGIYLIVPSSTASTNGSIIDLICFVGYKYIPLNCNLMINQWIESSKVAFILKGYLLFMFGIFLLRNVKFHVVVPGLQGGNGIVDRKQILRNCNYFLFFYGFIWQFVWMWVLN
ncbi:related to Protein transport protein YIF1 [Hanseniaspora guilliermondii]|uniref:Protein YIF1 n=1 Tax=Hanseniaspora guilliermondii TaxID=56406 RepID=A0A1L0B6W0_9ASCO|nr:related to Protein transport protein YIF1 [Hanseniaspora guilliermondii]